MIKKVLYYVPSMVVPLALNIVILFFCGRWLCPAEYGLMSIYTTTITTLYSLGMSFMQNSALRFYTDPRCVDKAVYFTTFVISNLVLATLTFLLVVASTFFIPNVNVWIISLSVLANALYLFCVNIDRLEDRHIAYTSARCLASVLNLVGFVVLAKVFNYVNYSAPIISMYCAYMLIALVKLFQRRRGWQVKKYSPDLFKDSLKFGAPLIGVSVIGSLIAHSDQFMILYFLDKEQVGLYALGFKIADYSVSRFTTLLLVVATPAIIRLYDQGKIHDSEKMIRGTVDAIAWLWFALASFCFMYCKEFIAMVFPKYEGAETIMQVVIFAALFHCASQLYCKPFELAKRTTEQMTCSIIAGVISIGYNWIFIPIHGTIAAAVSSVLAYVFLDAALLIRGSKYMNVWPTFLFTLKMFFTAAVTCGVAFVLKRTTGCATGVIFLTHVIICGVVYIGLSYLTGQFKGLFEFKLGKENVVKDEKDSDALEKEAETVKE